MAETEAAVVFRYFQKQSVAAVRVTKGSLKPGDRIHILGNTTDIVQAVESMESGHAPVEDAKAGDQVGIKVAGRVRPNDVVYRVSDD